MSTTATTPYERCTRLVARLNELTDIEWTFGYIGNCGVDSRGQFDDRCWYAFAAHPGRVGTSHDSIGGVTTDRLDELVRTLAGAVALARVQHARR